MTRNQKAINEIAKMIDMQFGTFINGVQLNEWDYKAELNRVSKRIFCFLKEVHNEQSN